MSEFLLTYWVLGSPNNSYKSLTVVSSDRFPLYNVLNSFWCGGFKMANFVLFFEQQYYFLETVASVALLCFADIAAGVGDGVDNGPNIVAVVFGCDFLSNERV